MEIASKQTAVKLRPKLKKINEIQNDMKGVSRRADELAHKFQLLKSYIKKKNLIINDVAETKPWREKIPIHLSRGHGP